MLGTSDPNQVVAMLGIGLLIVAALWRLIGWIQNAPATPDPWDNDVQRKLDDAESREICPHCLAEQEPTAWFCPHCGRAVGPYNNLMPFINAFSVGEVVRNGVSARFRNRPVVLIGYFLISLATYAVFAPIFWFFLLANLRHPPNPTGAMGDPVDKEAPPRT